MNTAEKCQQLELAPLEMGRTTLKNKCKSSSIRIKESDVGVSGHSKNGPSCVVGFRLLLLKLMAVLAILCCKRQAFG